MIQFVYGFLETKGGSTNPLAQLTPAPYSFVFTLFQHSSFNFSTQSCLVYGVEDDVTLAVFCVGSTH